MIEIDNKAIEKDQVLSSLNFMKISDVIFAATLSYSDLKKFNIKNFRIIENNNNLITFVNCTFELKENDIIFCQSDYLELLFQILKNEKFENLKLISSQSDRKINRNIFNKKPSCIKYWYSTNVTFKSTNLKSIPLGIAPYRNTKSVIFDDFNDINVKNNKNISIYSNFNVNTNYFHRVRAYKQVNKSSLCNLQNFKSYKDYLENLNQNFYSIAPWGNGIDTHRIWESIYLGVVPITKDHLHYRNLNHFPILLLKSYKHLSKIKNFKTSENINYNALKINWWREIINEHKVVNYTESKLFTIEKKEVAYLENLLKTKSFKNKFFKKILTLLRKLDSKINIFHKI